MLADKDRIFTNRPVCPASLRRVAWQTVVPAQAGIQRYLNPLDSRFCGNDKQGRA